MRFAAMAVGLLVVLTAPALARPPASRPDEGSLGELIRRAEETLEKRPADYRPAEDEDQDDDSLAQALLKKASARENRPVMDRVLTGMAIVASRCDELDPSLKTQNVQKQIARDLKEAIAAAAQASVGTSGSSGPDPRRRPQPLLPSVADLRFILSFQLDINADTIDCDRDMRAAKADEQRKLVHASLHRLADRQRELRDVVEQWVNRLRGKTGQ